MMPTMESVARRLVPYVSVVVLSLASTLACETLRAWPRKAGCPVLPVSTDELPKDTSLRARMQLRVGDREIGLEVVARMQNDELVVVGLVPHGTRLFSVRQRGREFEVEPGSSARTRILALWVMDALHRAYWIAAPGGDLRGEEDSHFEWAGERVWESRHSGRRRRVFARADPESADSGVTIEYSQPSSPGHPGPTTIRSDWCGYEAVVALLGESLER